MIVIVKCKNEHIHYINIKNISIMNNTEKLIWMKSGLYIEPEPEEFERILVLWKIINSNNTDVFFKKNLFRLKKINNLSVGDIFIWNNTVFKKIADYKYKILAFREIPEYYNDGNAEIGEILEYVDGLNIYGIGDAIEKNYKVLVFYI